MLMLKALRNRSMLLLWCGQATSTIGDEIYRVALIWLAVGLIGPDTGYLAASQCGALLLLSLFGGRWAARWDPFRTMIAVDLLRGLVVLLPVAASFFGPVHLPILVAVALAVSGLSAFFDPALVSMVPRFSHGVDSLQAANGLMSTTYRLGRAIGPGIVGVLSLFLPTIHFFTLDALTFVISAASIWALASSYNESRKNAPRPADCGPTVSAELMSELRGDRLMSFLLIVKAIGNGFWSLAYSLGLALFVKQTAPNDMSAFGALIASYGIGNLTGAVLLGNIRRKRPLMIIYFGYLTMGAGFAAVGWALSLKAAMTAMLWAGFWGPFNDMPFVDILLTRFSVHDIPQIHRLRIALDMGAILMFLALSPTIFRHFTPQSVIGASGFGLVALGLLGFAFFPTMSPRRAAVPDTALPTG